MLEDGAPVAGIDQVIEQNQTDDALADVSTEVPSVEQEASPAPAQEGWDNDTGLHAALRQWGASFCQAHRVGYFCNQYTRVRCCRTGWGYSMCGSTVHSSQCGWHAGWGAGGWHAGGWHAGGWHFNEGEQNSGGMMEQNSAGSGSWVIHAGWRQSSFCTSRHTVGYFCYSHHKVHCCNDHGYFVECTTRSESSWRC